jgi:hypothetical protein
MWISVPTPVMSSTNNPESGSNVYDMSTWNGPASIQVNIVFEKDRSASSRPSSSMNAKAPMTNEIDDAAVPMR